jgi:hypothetical protein
VEGLEQCIEHVTFSRASAPRTSYPYRRILKRFDIASGRPMA